VVQGPEGFEVCAKNQVANYDRYFARFHSFASEFTNDLNVTTRADRQAIIATPVLAKRTPQLRRTKKASGRIASHHSAENDLAEYLCGEIEKGLSIPPDTFTRPSRSHADSFFEFS
jgi:hypothetical protein